MKNIKNKNYLFLCAFLLSFCLFTSIKVQASSAVGNSNNSYIELPAQYNVSLNKKWTITFTSQVKMDKIDGVVIQKDSQFIPVTVDISDTKSITVQPVNPYSENSKYTLKLFLSNGKKYSLDFTTEKVSDSSPKVLEVTVSNNGSIAVTFDRAMNQQSAFVASKWEINGRALSDMDFKESDFGIDNNNTTILLKNLKNYMQVGTNTLYIHSNILDVYGNRVDEDSRLNFEYVSGTDNTDKASMQKNSFKLSYFGDDIKAEVQFNKDLKQISCSDFTVAGEQADYAEISGNKASLIFKSESKDANGLNKVDVIRVQGVNAMLSSIKNPTTEDVNEVSINYIEPVQVYEYLLAPRTVQSKFYATQNGNVVLKFDANIDPNSAVKFEDFSVESENGTELKANSVTINTNTNEIVLNFDMNNSDNIKAFTTQNSVFARIKSTVSIRGFKDQKGNYDVFTPSTNDLRKTIVKIIK